MSYYEDHTEDDCDKCGKRVGKKNLRKADHLYLDKNDKVHEDMSPKLVEAKRKELMRISKGDLMFTEIYMKKFHVEPGYRQYFLCKKCVF